MRYLLKQNAGGLKLGCIVNDVAAVNIDAKLVITPHPKALDPS